MDTRAETQIPRAGRVLLLTSNFPRWAGDATTPFVLHLAQDLREFGWQVDVLAPHAPGSALEETLDDVAVRRFRYLWPASLQSLCYRGGALVNLRRSRSRFLQVPPFVLAEWAAALRRLATGRYGLLHSHWIVPQGFTGVLAARPLGVPHVATVHGGDVFALNGRLLSGFKRFALRGADAVTVNSSATLDAVERIAPGLADLRRIPMGVTVRRGAGPGEVEGLRARYRSGAGPLLVFVGRIVEEKGVADLIRAVSIARPRLPDISSVIVGEGPDRAAMEALVRDSGLADRISFAGWVEPERVSGYLAAADVFVGPSRRAPDGWIEAQGLTFLEAMSAGTPVVATRCGGVTDAVRHEETGLLVSEAAPEEIAAAVERLVAAPGLAEALARAGSALVARRFTRRASARAFSDLFHEVISDRAGGRLRSQGAASA